MRIIVLSDTHQYYRNFETIVLRHPDADMFIHLGDGESEYQLLCRNMPEVADKFRYIKGNCDYGSEAPLTQTIDLSNRNAVAENCCCSVSLNCSVYRNRRISPKRRLAAVCRNSSRSVSTRSFCSFAGRLSQSFAASRRDTDSETVNPSAIPSQFKYVRQQKIKLST